MPRNTVGKVVAARQPTHANTMAGNRNSFYYAAMDTIRCKWLQGMTSLLALALAVATIQGLMSCGARSRDTSGETSRSGRGAITLDAATRRQVIIEDVLHREAIRSDRAVPAVSLREERRDFRGRRRCAGHLGAGQLGARRRPGGDRNEAGLPRRSGSV